MSRGVHELSPQSRTYYIFRAIILTAVLLRNLVQSACNTHFPLDLSFNSNHSILQSRGHTTHVFSPPVQVCFYIFFYPMSSPDADCAHKVFWYYRLYTTETFTAGYWCTWKSPRPPTWTASDPQVPQTILFMLFSPLMCFDYTFQFPA